MRVVIVGLFFLGCAPVYTMLPGFFPKPIEGQVTDFMSLDYNQFLPTPESDSAYNICIDRVDRDALYAEVQLKGLSRVIANLEEGPFTTVTYYDPIEDAVKADNTSYTIEYYVPVDTNCIMTKRFFYGSKKRYSNILNRKRAQASGKRQIGECTVAEFEGKTRRLYCETKFYNKAALLKVLDTFK